MQQPGTENTVESVYDPYLAEQIAAHNLQPIIKSLATLAMARDVTFSEQLIHTLGVLAENEDFDVATELGPIIAALEEQDIQEDLLQFTTDEGISLELDLNFHMITSSAIAEPQSLTPAQAKIVRVLMRRPRNVHSYISLLPKDYDRSTFSNAGASTIVKPHMVFIRQKIGCTPEAPIIHTYPGLGYSLSSSASQYKRRRNRLRVVT